MPDERPYIVTTTTPRATARTANGRDLERHERSGSADVSRSVVRTLREMRRTARKAVEDRAQAPGWTPDYIAARILARELPESGGTIRLPDGTVIEVSRAR